MHQLKRRAAHAPHRPGKLGLWLNSLPENWKWVFPVHLSRQLYLVENDVTSEKLPRALHGLKIAYASDIHFGALLKEERVIDLAERLNALEADIILLGGDYGEDAAHTLEFFRLLPPLKAKLAVCGVIGNHDRAEATAEELIDAMETCGITPLVNSTLTLEMDGKKLCICATDDLSHGDPAFNEVKEQVFGADYVIYAPHSPDALEAAREEGADGFYDLVVCGHTHGGQVAVFGFAPYTSSLYGARYGNLYLSGEIEEDDGTQIIISNGVGTTWMPVRFGAPPQYHLITLRRARPER
ncbi:MAG: metallophosphoesterase [Clostridia bacterium]|nr:metallophosphoesterase [Clostridia bacterium]